jgi:uracil phosphoribosyltransferase
VPLTVVDHPLIQHKLSIARDQATDTKTFRDLVSEIAALLTYEATREIAVESSEIETPLERMTAAQVSGKKLAVVPIFRAGLGMLDAVIDLLPVARVGFVGLYRDENSLEPVEYYSKFPSDLSARDVLLLDPMLATAGSASAACTLLKQHGAVRITMICLVAAPEGAARLERDHPDVQVFAAALDRQLDDVGYILPGLGDAGDRLFGTR